MRKQLTMTTRYSDCKVLTVPGLHGSGLGHWQTLWEHGHPEFQRVKQRDWEDPQLGEWAVTIEKAVAAVDRPVLLVAHSFGCLAIARASSRIADRVRGALLVSPADPARFGVDALLPKGGLGFPSILVASSNDPWLELARAQRFAREWGSRFINLGACGHINAASGFGQWPFGKLLLDELRLTSATKKRLPVEMVS